MPREAPVSPRLLRGLRSSTLPASLRWRDSLRRDRLVANLASVLLQRKRWAPLLRSRHPSLPATFSADPLLLPLVLSRVSSHPLLALDFLAWSESALGLQPDLRSRCKMLQILAESGNFAPAKGMLEAMLRSSASDVFAEVSRLCRHVESRACVLGLLLGEFARSGRVLDALGAFQRIRASGCPPLARTCNVLLDRLIASEEIRGCWCFYAAVLRAGVEADSRTFMLLARLLCKQGKLERAMTLVESGAPYEKVCNLVAECYSRNGDFVSSFNILKSMREKNLNPGFAVYSSILDGGCRHNNADVVGSCLRDMFVKGLLANVPSLDYDMVIRRLCESNKIYAVEMFLQKSRYANARLLDGTYTYILRALSKAEKIEEAMGVYHLMSKKCDKVNYSCLDVFLRAVCNGEPSSRGSQVLKDVLHKGFVCSRSDMSKYIANLCGKELWKDAEDLLNLLLEKRIVPDTGPCASLVHHFCAHGHVDLGMTLFNKLKRLGGGLDVITYNKLLDTLTTEGRLIEAMEVFSYMREQDTCDGASFVIIITVLIQENELRKAMNLHDEMLKFNLKPDDDTYRRLISGFA